MAGGRSYSPSYLDEITGGRGIVFATGTPISNSMVELTAVVWLVWGIDDLTQKSNLQSFRFTHEFWA